MEAVTRALRRAFAVTLAFWLLIEVTKSVPPIYRREPWQDDPFDALLSFLLTTIPFWTALCAVRLLPPRPSLPVRRAVDLIRALQAMLVVIAGAELSEWVSLALGEHRPAWNLTTAVLVVLLAMVTTATAGAWASLRRARALFPVRDEVPAQPDWIADAVSAARWTAGRLGRAARPAAGVVRLVERLVAEPLRRRPLLTTGWLSLLGGVVVSLPQIVIEAYPPLLAVLFVLIGAGSLFAFLVLVGAWLPVLPGTRRPSPGTVALVAAALALPFAATCRDAIWAVLGIHETSPTVGDLARLCLWTTLAAAALGGGVALLTDRLRRGRPGRPEPGAA